MIQTHSSKFLQQGCSLGGVLCGALTPRDFHPSSPLNKHLGGHRYQNIAEVQEGVSQVSHMCLTGAHMCLTGVPFAKPRILY